MHIADDEARSRRDRVRDVAAARRHARHALTRLGEFETAARIHVTQQLHRVGIMQAGHAECLRHGVRRDVVMGRANPARSEDIGVFRPERIERLDDRILLVGDDADFLEIDAGNRQEIGEMADILVLGAGRTGVRRRLRAWRRSGSSRS